MATPTPPAPGHLELPADFRLNFVNGCNALRYPRVIFGGDVRGQCDTTPRYIGTLASGERHGDACDPGHVSGNPKTRELCGGPGARDFDSPAGSRLEVRGAVEVERDSDNPYQFWLVATPGAVREVRACPGRIPIVTHDGLNVPVSGDGCGEWKPVTFIVPPVVR